MNEPRGYARLLDPARNQSTAFSRDDRERYGLRGLLPHRVTTMDEQAERVMTNLRSKACDIERYILLRSLQDRNEQLFYRIAIDHVEEIMPIVYTPTVGRACEEFANIFRRTRGFYVTPEDSGRVRSMLDNWPERDVRCVVVTDGERILGLGDLGANGMGIPIGKLALYTTCAGIPPAWCLPIQLDVGTNNEELRTHPMYLGYPHPRVGGEVYANLMDELMEALADAFPGVLVQFEDFLTPNAVSLLARYRDRQLCFNDDIQGTAAVALAGVVASTRATGTALRDLRILFLGAGSAATGIGDLIARALRAEGLSESDARERLSFVDSKGLIVASRTDTKPHQHAYAHDRPQADFLGAIEAVKPHVLIGATGSPGTFTEPAIRMLASLHHRPVVFALSNPTSRAECTAEQAYAWSDGRALFASGSPFDPVLVDGVRMRPCQGNNAYVFPGIGLGALAVRARRLPEELFLTAARALAGFVSQSDLAVGALYPRLTEIRRVSNAIAEAVAERAIELDVAGEQSVRGAALAEHIASMQYDPRYGA